MGSTHLTLGSFLRITSISVAIYDYLVTIPAEWRIYRSKGSMRFGFSLSKILFILIRYVSIILLVISNLGFYHHGFSAATCSRYYIVPPVLKVVQIMISQVIIGCRTWAITRRSKGLGVFLLVFGSIVTVLEWYAGVDLGGRIPVQEDGKWGIHCFCLPGNKKTAMPLWVFYLVSVVFDAVTCILSTLFLVTSASGFRSVFSMSTMTKMLFYDGLSYMAALTAVNILNLILFWESVGKGQQSKGASFGYMVVWIMSQRILIHTREVAEGHARRGVFVTHQRSAPRNGPHNVRKKFNSSSEDETETVDDGLEIQFRVEQVVRVDNYPVNGQEDYQELSVTWDKAQDATNGEKSPTERNLRELARV